jgi:hypothetical protein
MNAKTQKLEIKYLAPYLPYRLKFYAGKIEDALLIYPMLGLNEHYNKIISIKTFSNGEDTTYGFQEMPIEQYHLKPILRPMSELIKEIEHNGEKIIPCDYWDKEVNRIKYQDELRNMAKHSYCDGYLPYFIMEKLFEWNFDVFNLIDSDLAVNYNEINK